MILITIANLFEDAFYVFKLALPLLLSNIVTLVDIIASVIVIYRADQVKYHAAKVLKNIMDEAFILNIYVIPTIITLFMYCSLYVIYELFNL